MDAAETAITRIARTTLAEKYQVNVRRTQRVAEVRFIFELSSTESNDCLSFESLRPSYVGNSSGEWMQGARRRESGYMRREGRSLRPPYFPETISCIAMIMGETGQSGHNPGWDGLAEMATIPNEFRESPSEFPRFKIRANNGRICSERTRGLLDFVGAVWSVVPLHTNLRRKSERVPGRVPENPASTLETGLSYGDVDCDRGR